MSSKWPDTWPPAAEELHVFDPNGDVLFVLSRCIVLEDTRPSDEYHPSHDLEQDDLALNAEVIDWDADAAPEGYCSCYTAADGDADMGETNESRGTQMGRIPMPALSTDHFLVEVQLRVSSKHLSLASPTFRTMFGPDFSEGRILQMDGSIVVPLPDDDPDAFIILLNIVHGKARSVPRIVELELLTDLASLVDYYHLHEVAEVYGEKWVKGLDIQPDDIFDQADALKCLWTTWVFEQPEDFKVITGLILLHGTNDPIWSDQEYETDLRLIEADDLPIPKPILDVIKAKREKATTDAITVIHRLIDTFSDMAFRDPDEDNHDDEGEQCNGCDVTILGSLIKGAMKLGIWPPSQDPYDVTFSQVAVGFEKMKIYTHCDPDDDEEELDDEGDVADLDGGRDPLDVYGYKEDGSGRIKKIKESLCGLDLADYLPPDGAKGRA